MMRPRVMDVWSVSLMFGATALWTTMLVAVAVRIRLVRARGLEPPRAARPSGT